MIMMKKRSLILFLITLLVVGSISIGYAASEEKVFHWKITGPNVEGVPRQELLSYFSDSVEKASGGRLKIDLYPAGSLYPVFNALDAVKNGVTEGTITWGDYWGGKEPMLKLITYRPCDPFETLIESNYLLSKYEPLVKDAYQKLGVTYVSSLIALPGEGFLSNVPIRSIEDFKGLKVRSSGLGQELFKELGAAPVTMPMSEVYTGMKLGTLDCFESGGHCDNWQFGYQEIAKYIIEPTIHAPGALMGGHLLINNKAWEKLPDDLKEIVRYCGEATRLYIWSEIKKEDTLARQKFIDSGVEVITLSDASVKKSPVAGAKVLKSYRKASPQAAKFIDLYQDVLLELGYTDIAKLLE